MKKKSLFQYACALYSQKETTNVNLDLTPKRILKAITALN